MRRYQLVLVVGDVAILGRRGVIRGGIYCAFRLRRARGIDEVMKLLNWISEHPETAIGVAIFSAVFLVIVAAIGERIFMVVEHCK